MKQFCPICGSDCRLAGATLSVDDVGRADILTCPNCRHQWIPNPVAVGEEIAKKMERRNTATLSANWLFNLLPFHLGEVRTRSQVRALDIGCWDGSLLVQLPIQWTRHGVELNQDAADRAQTRGLTVFRSSFESIVDYLEPYDLILMMDLLEHIPSPEFSLFRIAQLLNPGGLFVALTGNGQTPAVRIFRGAWYYFNYPEHVSFFSETSCAMFLEKQGLMQVKVKKIAHHSASLSSTIRKTYNRILQKRNQGKAGLSVPRTFLQRIALGSSRVLRRKDHLLILARKS